MKSFLKKPERREVLGLIFILALNSLALIGLK
jgi:hypothetical protein